MMWLYIFIAVLTIALAYFFTRGKPAEAVKEPVVNEAPV